MNERRMHKILITVLVGLFLIIAGLATAIIFISQEPSYFALGTFEEKIEKADEIIGAIFYSDNNEYDSQKFIKELKQEIEQTSDPDQKIQFAIIAANYYYSAEDYEQGINLLNSIDSSQCIIDNRLTKLIILAHLYEASDNLEGEKQQITSILNLPDEPLENQDMSSVKEYYATYLEGLNE